MSQNVTNSGLKNDGLISGRISHNVNKPTDEAKRELAKKLRRMRDEDREIVRGVFHYYEVPDGVLEFSYKAYPGDQVETYQLFDKKIYSLPKGVAKHLNKNIAYPQYEYIQGEDMIGGYNQGFRGTAPQGMRISKKVRRCSFQSLEFLDESDFDNNPQRIFQVDPVLTSGAV